MPEPQWASAGLDMFERPQTSIEILGRGEGSRKSKTFIKDQELATLLGFIRGHTRRLFEVFRRSHARHHTKEVHEEQDDGTVKVYTEPDVLTDEEIRERYPIVVEWEKMHQEQVDHYASIGGFSVNAAAGSREDPDAPSKKESSAGADRRSKTGASKVGGNEPKWR